MIEIIQGGGLPDMGAFIGNTLNGMEPNMAQAQLAAIFANIVGNISDEQWAKIKESAKLPCECGDPGCKIAITAVIEAGDKARVQFNKALGVQPKDADEKGFSE